MRRRSRTLRRQKLVLGAIFLGIPLGWLFVFVVLPMFLVFALSFTSYNILKPPRWIGLGNFQDLLDDPLFLTALRNTLVYTLATVPLGIVLSLALALLVNRRLPGAALFRTIFYAPVMTPIVAVALVWVLFYDPTVGLFNYVLSRVGVAPQRWLTSSALAMPSVVAMSLWKGLGLNMVIFLAGLQAIPRELYEAAWLDGAGPTRAMRSVTLPLLMPSFVYVLVTSVVASFQVFSQVYVMTNGGPDNATTTL
ncbi:MAG: sugar ABC transporter permease, partial [Acetobacteraceae bacterium]|nr:sugar ABC transporter permease [Acetobacteraceae bacterium]